jgi:hypothetical protein
MDQALTPEDALRIGLPHGPEPDSFDVGCRWWSTATCRDGARERIQQTTHATGHGVRRWPIYVETETAGLTSIADLMALATRPRGLAGC